MQYGRDTIVQDVRVAMDQNGYSEPLAVIGDEDTLTLDEIIRSKIADAVNAVRLLAPVDKMDLQSKALAADSTEVDFPKDYLRLAMIDGGWSNVIKSITPRDNSRYQQFFSEFDGIAGYMAIMVDDKILFKPKVGENGGRIYYVPLASDGETYNLEPAIYKAYVLKTAALTQSALSNVDAMNIFNALTNETLGIR